MRITIEPETKEEKKQIKEAKVIEQVFEFAITGRFIKKPCGCVQDFSHLHTGADKIVLLNKLSELKDRLK